MTPAQVRGKVSAVQRGRRRWSLHNAWHGEVYHRTKRLKELDTYLGEQRYAPRAPQSVKSMMGTLKQMAKAQKAKVEKARNRRERMDKEKADG